MEYTEQQIAHFKTEFARRKRNQLIAAAPVVLIMVVVVLFRQQVEPVLEGLPSAISGAGLLIVFGGLIAFSLRNWRCPACNSYLGRSTSMHHCPKCGVALK
jgi:hypothetical protein